MADDFIDQINQEVDGKFAITEQTSLSELKDLFATALDDLKTTKIEMQDLQSK